MSRFHVVSLAEDNAAGGSAPFRAQALRVGKWDYPGLEGGLVITPELLAEFKESFDLHAKGPEVPLNLEHDDARPCGWVRGLELSDDGQTLYALFDVTEPDIREKVKNGTYRYVSSELDLSWNDPEGHFRGRPVFDGLALTTRPYIKRMEPVRTIDLTEWDESKVNRDEDGKFAEKPGGGGGSEVQNDASGPDTPDSTSESSPKSVPKDAGGSYDPESYGDLPELKGSEKQIAWANTIRDNQIKEFHKMLAKHGQPLDSVPVDSDVRKAYDGVVSNPSARFWIDNRNISLYSMMQFFNQESKQAGGGGSEAAPPDTPDSTSESSPESGPKDAGGLDTPDSTSAANDEFDPYNPENYTELPELKGSEKQIAWANTIRADKISKFHKELAQHNQPLSSVPVDSDVRKAYDGVVSNPSASYWIDNRNMSLNSMMQNFERDSAKKQELKSARKELQAAIAGLEEDYPKNIKILYSYINKPNVKDYVKDIFQTVKRTKRVSEKQANALIDGALRGLLSESEEGIFAVLLGEEPTDETIDLTEGVTFEAFAKKLEDVERTELEVRLSEMQAKLAAKDRELAKYRSRTRLTEVKARLSELATKRRGAVPLRVSTHITRLAEILLSQGKERIKLEEPMIIEEGTDTPVTELDVIDEMLELIESVVEAVGGGGDGAPESVQLEGHPSDAPTGDLEDDLLREAQVIMSEKRAGSLKEALLVALGGRNGR